MLNDLGPRTPAAPILLVAAAALIGADGRVLMRRRPPGDPLEGLWEFPGGKVEPGETVAAALARELEEELGIRIAAEEAVPVGFQEQAGQEQAGQEQAGQEQAGARPLVLLLFAVRRWTGTPQATDGAAIRRVPPSDLRRLAMPPPDVPLAAALERWLAMEARAGIEPACKDLQSSA